jgi:hypothetical protein
MTLTLQIPDSMAEGRSPKALGQEILEAYAAESFRTGKISKHQVRELLGHESRWDTEKFLGDRGVLMNLTVDEIVADAETAARFSQRRN